MGLPATRRLTYDEYLALEDETGRKHEYLDGDAWMMAGGTADHALISSNLTGLLFGALRGKPCRAFSSDWKIWMGDAQRAAYPDVSVICGPIVRPMHDQNSATNPTLVAEVLSRSTRDLDTSLKARDYRELPSLQVLLLVDSERVAVECFTRNDDDTWTVRDLRAGDRVELPALGLTVDVHALYADTELLQPPEAEAEAELPAEDADAGAEG